MVHSLHCSVRLNGQMFGLTVREARTSMDSPRTKTSGNRPAVDGKDLVAQKRLSANDLFAGAEGSTERVRQETFDTFAADGFDGAVSPGIAEQPGFRSGQAALTIRPTSDAGECDRVRVASFFAGIGGFDLGFERAGMQTVWQCEKKAFCLDILEKHWPFIERAADITKVSADEIPTASVWVGGFPCQDVSLARMGPRSGLRGRESGLFYNFADLIGERRPPLVVLENVAALLSSHHGRDFAVVIRTLAELGYGVAWRVLDSRYFGVPQSRSRVFIVGSLGGPASAGSVLFESQRGDRHSAKGGPNGEKSVSPFQVSVGDSRRGFVKKLAHCLYAESARHTGTDWSRNYVSYPEGRVRRLTPLETERLQGFPDGWTLPKTAIEDVNTLDSARYHACGNAVSVPVAEWLGARIVRQLGAWLLQQQAQNAIARSS